MVAISEQEKLVILARQAAFYQQQQVFRQQLIAFRHRQEVFQARLIALQEQRNLARMRRLLSPARRKNWYEPPTNADDDQWLYCSTYQLI